MLAIQKAQALGAVLIEQGVLRQEQLNHALAEQQRSGQLLGKALLQMDLASEEQVAQALARQLNVPFMDLRRVDVHPEIVRQLSEQQARRFSALVLEDRGDSYLVGL